MKRILFAAVLFTRTQILMGDVPVTLAVKAPESQKIAAFTAMEKAFEKARKIEGQASEFKPDSQTAQLNRNAGIAPVPVGEHLQKILQTARDLSLATDGTFDITYASKNRSVSYRDVEIGSESFLKKKGTVIKVSGLAKGYIVDRMGDVLREEGFSKYLINAGGEILARGRWKVSIRDPQNPDEEPVLNLKIKNRAVSTAGLYERGNHIFDAKTKKPVLRSGSVTVIARNSSLADAWDTAAFVMGKEKLETMRDKIPDVEFIFVENGQIN